MLSISRVFSSTAIKNVGRYVGASTTVSLLSLGQNIFKLQPSCIFQLQPCGLISTYRRRIKKMNKHKLKKRRKLLRKRSK
mmetsp:Transcript_4271/g.6387  ORF Transcript_4271/g.6387 Transcript_4271/m.6387 type:complete len:80 (+) Transcript_4271:95-334(+)